MLRVGTTWWWGNPWVAFELVSKVREGVREAGVFELKLGGRRKVSQAKGAEGRQLEE